MNEDEARVIFPQQAEDVLDTLFGVANAEGEAMVYAARDLYDVLVAQGMGGVTAANTLIGIASSVAINKALEPAEQE